MLSTRQLEAFVWTVRLKTLSRAAARLNMAQPTISKRIQELEISCGFDVFAKQGRSVTLTANGEALYEIAEQILQLLQQADDIKGRPTIRRRRVAIGVTELVAYTWLPRLVNMIRDRHPMAVPKVVVEQSASLLAKVRSGELDLIVTPSYTSEPQLFEVQAGEVSLALMGGPHVFARDRLYSGAELSRVPFISHGAQTGSVPGLTSWMRSFDWVPEEVIEIDSIAAQLGFATAGMGVALMPRECFQSLIDKGRLIDVKTANKPPDVHYRAVFRKHDRGGLLEDIAQTVRDAADFTSVYEA